MMSDYAGRFITLEGIEGVGKTTNREYIQALLEQTGTPCVVTVHGGLEEMFDFGAHALFADPKLSEFRTYFPVKAVAVHAEVGRSIAESDQAGLDLHALSAYINSSYLGSDMPQLGTYGQAGTLIGLPGAARSLDISAFEGETVHACFRYGADFDWYAQIDDASVFCDIPVELQSLSVE